MSTVQSERAGSVFYDLTGKRAPVTRANLSCKEVPGCNLDYRGGSPSQPMYLS